MANTILQMPGAHGTMRIEYDAASGRLAIEPLEVNERDAGIVATAG